MKKTLSRVICILLVLIFMCGCENSGDSVASTPTPSPVSAENAQKSSDGTTGNSQTAAKTTVDVDLTKLSSTMVYSEVYNMMTTPDTYVGKTVRMAGQFSVYSNEDQTQFYPAVVIADATACCSQGLEFVLAGKTYPDGYPESSSEIIVSGTFETYMEGEYKYCHLVNAVIE